MERRCVDDHCQENCIYAHLEKGTVKTIGCVNKPFDEWADQNAFDIYCTHPKFKEKKYVGFTVIIDESIRPNFVCPMNKEKKHKVNILDKLIEFLHTYTAK